MDTTVYRCNYCRQALCHADFAIAPSCPMCGMNKFSPAVKIEDDEMRALIQRGYRYDEANFVILDDRLLKDGKLPAKKDWIIEAGA